MSVFTKKSPYLPYMLGFLVGIGSVSYGIERVGLAGTIVADVLFYTLVYILWKFTPEE